MSGSATVATTRGTKEPLPRGRCGLNRAGAWWQEVALVAVLDLLYEVTRSLAPERVTQAFAHARAIERVERITHLDPERFLNHALDRVPALIPPLSVYYQIGHLVVLLSVLIWAWARHPYRYPLVRNTLVGLTLGALAGYWLFPTAPPRFALAGVIDTIAVHPVLLARQESVVGLVNAYAAMPSLHVAWAVWGALAVGGLSRARWRRLIWLHPATTTLAVLATANHYLLDVVAGVLLAVLAWLTGRSGRRAVPIRMPGRAREGGPGTGDSPPHRESVNRVTKESTTNAAGSGAVHAGGRGPGEPARPAEGVTPPDPGGRMPARPQRGARFWGVDRSRR